MPQDPSAHRAFDRWLSPLRRAAYLDACDGDPDAAFALYTWNGRLAGATLEMLGMVEVLVRNAVHARMKETTPPNALQSWLTDRDVLQEKQHAAVLDAVAKLRRAKKAPTEDRVIGGLYFSFWAQIVGTSYEELWRQRLAPAFPWAPNRKFVAGPINRLVQLRNRTAHHQTLFDQPVADRLADARAVAMAVDPAAAQWIQETSRVHDVLRERP